MFGFPDYAYTWPEAQDRPESVYITQRLISVMESIPLALSDDELDNLVDPADVEYPLGWYFDSAQDFVRELRHAKERLRRRPDYAQKEYYIEDLDMLLQEIFQLLSFFEKVTQPLVVFVDMSGMLTQLHEYTHAWLHVKESRVFALRKLICGDLSTDGLKPVKTDANKAIRKHYARLHYSYYLVELDDHVKDFPAKLSDDQYFELTSGCKAFATEELIVRIIDALYLYEHQRVAVRQFYKEEDLDRNLTVSFNTILKELHDRYPTFALLIKAIDDLADRLPVVSLT